MKKGILDLSIFGGRSAFNRFRTTMNLPEPDRESFFAMLQKSYTGGRITHNGPLVQLLEKRLAEYHQVRHCIAFCTCFVGMTIALRELAIPGKTEIVVPTLTYRRMADMIIWAGYVPRFCDVDPDTLGVTPREVALSINENTALILAPHPISNLSDIEGLEQLSRQRKLPLFFDSVEAGGGSYKGRIIGSFGDAEAFSMHPSKVINGAEGGYITTNNNLLAEALQAHRANGYSADDEVVGLGCNARLNDLHAALALASLGTIEKLIKTNRQHHLEYQAQLEQVDGLRVVKYPLDQQRNWKSVLIEIEASWPLTRRQTLDILNMENIHARAYYAPAQHTTISKQAGAGEIAFPVTDQAVEQYMLLPFGWSVSLKDIATITGVLKFISEKGSQISRYFSKGQHP